jgi:hypothetical protein
MLQVEPPLTIRKSLCRNQPASTPEQDFPPLFINAKNHCAHKKFPIPANQQTRLNALYLVQSIIVRTQRISSKPHAFSEQPPQPFLTVFILFLKLRYGKSFGCSRLLIVLLCQRKLHLQNFKYNKHPQS